MAAVSSVIYQSAVLPTSGEQLCLITSRGGRHWGLPKGAIEDGETGPEAALREAWEEAGLQGRISDGAIGAYICHKDIRICHVTLYPMEVMGASTRWPEHEERDRLWLPWGEAIEMIHQPALRALCRNEVGNRVTVAAG